MKFWPMSVIASSPMMPWHHQSELYEVQHRNRTVMTLDAVQACGGVAMSTQGIDAPNLGIIESIGANTKRFFNDYPLEDEWLRLERVIVLEDDAGRHFIILDVLH